jgi:aminoglycoside phosphotransferase (APT) family kinase protein
MDKAAGQPLSKVADGLSAEEWCRVGRSAGETLGKAHTVRAGGFYQRHPDGRWDFPDWRSLMDSTVHDRAADGEWIRQAGFSDGELAYMIRMIEVYRDEFNCPDPILCHGDFLPEHIFVDEALRVTALIDFGMCQGAHPIHDFTTLAMSDTGLTPELVLAGYPRRAWVPDRFQLRLHLHKLTLGMGFLAHHVRIEHYAEIPANARSLRETLEHLQRERL